MTLRQDRQTEARRHNRRFNRLTDRPRTLSSSAGKPRPTVTWWKDYRLIDESYFYDAEDNLVKNVLEIEALTRDDLLSVIVCQASNNNITVPNPVSVTLDLNRECCSALFANSLFLELASLDPLILIRQRSGPANNELNRPALIRKQVGRTAAVPPPPSSPRQVPCRAVLNTDPKSLRSLMNPLGSWPIPFIRALSECIRAPAAPRRSREVVEWLTTWCTCLGTGSDRHG